MNVRALIVRELRAEARRAGNYWVRTLAAGVLTALFIWAVWNFGGSPNSLGPMLFLVLSKGLLLSVLIIVSALTGDSVSREKREGTLGLLFLTPLSAWDIVIGKALLHTLRAGVIFLAVAPIIVLPFLLGGILATQVIIVFWTFIVALMIAVMAGILASVYTTEWIQSVVWAQLIAAGLVGFYFFLFDAAWKLIARFLPKAGANLATLIALSLLIFAVSLAAALWHAGRYLKVNWQRESSEREEPWWVRFFSESVFWKAAFRWNTRKARDRNPIAWLQEYNWTSRLTKWGWCALLFAAQMRMLMQFRRYVDYQMQLYVLTAMGIAFSAAASFRRERQTGALELLLVTPISARQLIWGRMQGVWFHFLPAIAIISCVWIMGPQWISLPSRFMFYLAGAYFFIPVIGFYCSLLSSNVLIAWLLTLLFGLLAPYALTQGFYFHIGRWNIPAAFFVIQAVFGIIATYLLYENLAQRRFALGRA